MLKISGKAISAPRDLYKPELLMDKIFRGDSSETVWR
jgi:hypothetical protein